MEIVTVRLQPETKAALEAIARSLGERPTETMRRILEEASGTASETAYQQRSFTEVQRMILIRQLDILSLLDPDHRDDYARDRVVLERGYTGQYGSVRPYLAEELPRQDCDLVDQLVRAVDLLDRSVDALPDDSPTRRLVAPVLREDLYRGFSRDDGPTGRQMAEYARFVADCRADLPDHVRGVFTRTGGVQDLPAQSPRYRELADLVTRYQRSNALPGGLLGATALVQVCLRVVPAILGTETARADLDDARGHLAALAQLPDDDLQDTVLDVLEESFADRVYDETSGNCHEVVREVPDEWFWGLIDAAMADYTPTTKEG